MVALTTSFLVPLLASFALGAPAQEPAADAAVSPRFILKTVANNGNHSLGGQYVAVVHNGAGSDGVVTVPHEKDAVQFQLTADFLVIHYPTDPSNTYYTFSFNNFRPERATKNKGLVKAAPKGYLVTSAYIGNKPRNTDRHQGYFSTGTPKGAQPLQFDRARSLDWNTFTVCYIKPSTYPLPAGNTLLYRTLESKPDKSGQCADVGLVAHFL